MNLLILRWTRREHHYHLTLPEVKEQESRTGGIDLSKVSARKNLNETAFFFPKLISDKDGIVRMEFTMPEALTKWKFLGFAHDKEMRSGFPER
jgi:uncharacterized protein YfaS (alpha-2-macroglobulin family)